MSGFALALFLVIYDFTKVHPEYQQYLLAITPLLVNEMIDDEQVRDSALDHLEKIFRRGQH